MTQRTAIIGGTGVYQLPGVEVERRVVETPYGEALVFLGLGEAQDLVFLPRHGPDHTLPPHRINYRANLKALHLLGVRRVMAAFAVGSLQPDIPPRSLVALDQFLDFTHGREATFFEGGEAGLVHVEVTEPYCPALRARFLELAAAGGVAVQPQGTYVCTNGPRFESAAEVRMYAQLGGDVVGMTGLPEVVLARELRMHYAGVALSINWGAGIQGALEIEQGLEARRAAMLRIFIETLRSPPLGACPCEGAGFVMHPPAEGRP